MAAPLTSSHNRRPFVRALLPALLCAALALARLAGAQAPDPGDLVLPKSPNAFINPISTPVEQEAAFVHTREFAQLPDEAGSPAKIVSMTLRGRFLYVCTLLSIYRISPRGRVSRFMDVAAAVFRASRGARNISLGNIAHGGVRSVAFPPRFPRDPRFYVTAMETRPNDTTGLQYLSDVETPMEADSVLLEFRYDQRRERVDPRSYRSLFRIGMEVYDHPIKDIRFRWEYLYISHGDGATQNASLGGGQNADGLGKIMRIVPMHPRRWRGRTTERELRRIDASGRKRYRIPPSNPFVRDPSMLDEVWALGFRNPHTLCFGPDGTLYVGETGRSNVEEVNIAKRGRNYGWSVREGQFVAEPVGGVVTGIGRLPDNDARNGFEYPAAVYGHNGAVGKEFTTQAIAGGCPVDNGSPMDGQFYYSDFPLSGRLFFSSVSELRKARTRGPPSKLTVAPTKQAVVCLHRRRGGGRRGRWEVVRVNTFGNATRVDSNLGPGNRTDVRFGQGRFGELYWSAKVNGKIYVLLSSLPGGPSDPC